MKIDHISIMKLSTLPQINAIISNAVESIGDAGSFVVDIVFLDKTFFMKSVLPLKIDQTMYIRIRNLLLMDKIANILALFLKGSKKPISRPWSPPAIIPFT